jgi:hypothetical protein
MAWDKSRRRPAEGLLLDVFWKEKSTTKEIDSR